MADYSRRIRIRNRLKIRRKALTIQHDTVYRHSMRISRVEKRNQTPNNMQLSATHHVDLINVSVFL